MKFKCLLHGHTWEFHKADENSKIALVRGDLVKYMDYYECNICHRVRVEFPKCLHKLRVTEYD